MRSLFLPAVIGLALAVVLAACDETEAPPEPTVVRLAIDLTLEERAHPAVVELLTARDLVWETAVSTAEADLVVGAEASAGGVPFVTRYWVAASGRWSMIEGLTMARLGEAAAGRNETMRLIVPAGDEPPFEAWWPGVAASVEAMDLPEIAGVLSADGNAVTLLPLDAVDVRVRSLAVDGGDIVFGVGGVRTYPLVERGSVSVRPVDDADLAAALNDVAAALAEELTLPPPEPVILRATGDIIPARCVYAKQREYGDFRHAFLELGPWLAEADITVGSLDASISDAGVPFDCVRTFSLLAPAASVEGLAYAGFDVMTVATNHAKDCGQSACGDQAFFETLEILRANAIAPAGGGADLAAAREPAVVTAGGVRFAFLGYDEIAPYYHAAPGLPGIAPLTEANLREDIAEASERADVVVVLPQWGIEYTANPTARQRALARVAVEAGADLVVGNHPHWVQAAEVIEGAFVAYALGNFVFDQDWSLETRQGVVLEAAFHGPELKSVRYHPIQIIDSHQPVFAEPLGAQQIMERIRTASVALGSP